MFFLIQNFSKILLSISLIISLYVFYKSNIYYDGSKIDYYITYYVFSLFLIIFSILSFFISHKLKEYLIITTVCLVLSLYFFEGYLSLEKRKIEIQKNELYKEKNLGEFDRRSFFKAYEDSKKFDINTRFLIYPSQFLTKNEKILPLSGISNANIILGNENGYFPYVKTDRFGFNNPDYEWDSREIEFLLIGDSFTFGVSVNRPDDIASVLRKVSNKSVLNLGYPDNGPLIEYATLKEYLSPNVKKILWIYFEGNDLINLNKELGNKVLKNYLNNIDFTQNLKFRQLEIDSMANNFHNIVEARNKKINFNFNFLKLYNLRKFIYGIMSQIPKPQKEFKQLLEMANILAKQNKSELYFIYLPDYYRYKSENKDFNYKLVKKIVDDLNIPFIDMDKEVFKKSDNPLKFFPFQFHNHYNELGYHEIGNAIYRLLK